MSDEQQNHANNLKMARIGSLKNSAQNIRKNVKAAVNVVSLTAYLEPFTDWLFGIALILAIIKDIFDLVNNALIAAFGIGIPLIVVFTAIVSLAIGFIMLLTGSSGKRKTAKKIAQGLLKRFLLLVGASAIEAVPAISLLPLESLVVIIIFWLTLVERKKNAEAQKEQAAAMAAAA
ncbi:MAG: hypothetical protein Q8L11_02765 [Candidatus Moranbacteria bacterium]|nr:hypothetical protein [bacterium]MDP1833830.1 hypothetical protein [Candidatus Moranbacteria bacterium]